MTNKLPSGYVLYEGPSLLDSSAPIVVIATIKSGNKKTANMVQTWILRSDIPPYEAVKNGSDSAICGDCPHRDGSCYVLPFQAPTNVYKAYKRGIYPELLAPYWHTALEGREIRIGSYGDPAAVPGTVWHYLVQVASSHTGYTRQWRTNPQLQEFCMASVLTMEEKREAKELGWRTFRLFSDQSELDKEGKEILCPGSKEAGFKLTCEQCKACDGNYSRRKGDVGTVVHGAPHKVKKFQQIVELI